jgi:hydrogenase expression/formation protein HypC
MCLSLPVKVEEITGRKARVSIGGNEYQADISLLENIAVGDYILLHAGFGIQKIDEQHARETILLMEEMAKKNYLK